MVLIKNPLETRISGGSVWQMVTEAVPKCSCSVSNLTINLHLLNCASFSV